MRPCGRRSPVRSAARLQLARSQSSCSLQRMRTAHSMGSLRLQLARMHTGGAQRCQIATGALAIVFQTTSRASRRLQGESKAATGTLASILRSTIAVFGARRRQKALAGALELVTQHFVKRNANVISIKLPSTSSVRGAPVTQLAAPAHSSLSIVIWKTASDKGTMENATRANCPPPLQGESATATRMRLGCRPRVPGRAPGCGNPARPRLRAQLGIPKDLPQRPESK